MATITAAAGGGNWTNGPTWVGGIAPTAADDAVLNGTSGNVVINSGSVARSLDCTGYTGTLTHAASVTLTLGDGTAGVGNVALKLVAGMTYTLGNSASSTIVFASTSATQQTITTGGKQLGSWTVNGAGSSYQLADTNNASGGGATTVTLNAGTLDTNGQTCSWSNFTSSITNVRTLTLGASSITIASSWSCATATNMTLNAGTSTITFNGGGGATFNSGINLSYNNIVFSGAGTCTITSSGGVGTGVYANITRTGTAVKTDDLTINTAITISGTLTLNGNSVTNRVLLTSNVTANQRTITVNGSVVASNVDIRDIIGAGSASWNLAGITGGSGDGGGNSGITFTTSAAQTWSGTSGGNWSANAWTSRVPLPQDDVVINAAFSASQTVTADMPRIGKSINWTGATGAPTWNFTTSTAMHGSLTLAAGMTVSGAATFGFRGRGAGNTITTNGVSLAPLILFAAGSGATYTLQDAFTTTNTLTVGTGTATVGGTLNTNGQTLTCLTLLSVSPLSGSALTLGASTINLTSTATATVLSVDSLSVVNAGTSNIVITSASANTRTFAGGGKTYGTLTYTVAGSTGQLSVTGANTFSAINFSDASNARTMTLPASTNTIITNSFNVQGTAGKLMTINSSTGGAAATLTKTSGYVSCDYLSLQDSTATGGASWYAGANSAVVSNVTGWFLTPPNRGAFLSFLR